MTTLAPSVPYLSPLDDNLSALGTELQIARCVLFYGPVGCGKTATLNYLAKNDQEARTNQNNVGRDVRF